MAPTKIRMVDRAMPIISAIFILGFFIQKQEDGSSFSTLEAFSG
ncbi:MAG: hypothetical protein ACJA0J_001095 [Bdellovibrionota bacterium]